MKYFDYILKQQHNIFFNSRYIGGILTGLGIPFGDPILPDKYDILFFVVGTILIFKSFKAIKHL